MRDNFEFRVSSSLRPQAMMLCTHKCQHSASKPRQWEAESACWMIARCLEKHLSNSQCGLLEARYATRCSNIFLLLHKATRSHSSMMGRSASLSLSTRIMIEEHLLSFSVFPSFSKTHFNDLIDKIFKESIMIRSPLPSIAKSTSRILILKRH